MARSPVAMIRIDSLRLPSEADALHDSRMLTIQQAIAACMPGGVIEVTLTPRAWWATRLYLLATLATPSVDPQHLLFLNQNGSFVGLSSACVVRESLVRIHQALASYDAQISKTYLPPNLDSAIARAVSDWANEDGPTRWRTGSCRKRSTPRHPKVAR
jgi:hypothetical protein